MPIFKALDYTGTDTSDATATTSNILSGKTAYIASGKVTGSMTNRGTVSGSVGIGGTYTIQQGYHSGSGTVTGPTLSGNATAAEVRKNRTFYASSSSKLTGTMNDLGDYRYIPNQTLHMTTRSSYTDGTGTSQSISNTKFLSVYEGCTGYIGNSSNEHMILASRLGNASASDVRSGYTFTSGNSEVAQSGTMSSYTDTARYLNPGESYYINPGYHSGGYVYANTVSPGTVQYLTTRIHTNSSPTSPITTRMIVTGINYSGYDFLRITYRKTTTDSTTASVWIKLSEATSGVYYAMGSTSSWARPFSLGLYNSISFYAPSEDTGARAIPVYVDGIKVYVS